MVSKMFLLNFMVWKSSHTLFLRTTTSHLMVWNVRTFLFWTLSSWDRRRWAAVSHTIYIEIINYLFQCFCNSTTLTNIYFIVELKQVYSYQHKHCLSLNRVSSLKLLVWPWWIDRNSGELKIQLITYQLYNKQNISYEKYLSLRRNFL